MNFAQWGWTDPLPSENMYVSSYGGFTDSQYPKDAGIHLGVDLLGSSDDPVKVATPVLSVCPGRVEDKLKTESHEDVYMSAIFIVDDSGVVFVYGHVRDPRKGALVTIGDRVAAGQQIGEIGPITYRGAWPKAHLHLGVNTQGHGYYHHPQKRGWGIAPSNATLEIITEEGWVDPVLYVCEHPTKAPVVQKVGPSEISAVDYPATIPAHYRNAFDKAGLRGYCTWYAAERWLWARDSIDRGDYVEFKGQGRVWDAREELPSTGPAAKWLDDAQKKHLLHVDHAKPVKGSIVVFGTTSNNSGGHMAYVESVDETACVFVFSQMNAGSNLDPKTLKTEYFNKITMDSLKIGATIYKGMKVLGFIYPPEYPFDSASAIPDKSVRNEPFQTVATTQIANATKPMDSSPKPQNAVAEKAANQPKFRRMFAQGQARGPSLWNGARAGQKLAKGGLFADFLAELSLTSLHIAEDDK